jgi:hypothetical protein
MWTLRGFHLHVDWIRRRKYRSLHFNTEITIHAHGRTPKGYTTMLVHTVDVSPIWIPAYEARMEDLDEHRNLALLQGIVRCLEEAFLLCPEDVEAL